MPPSGHVAGIWGRNDDTRGVHKAPANEVVGGARSPRDAAHQNEHDLLNPAGINVIRRFPGAAPHLGRAHGALRPGVALPERAAALH